MTNPAHRPFRVWALQHDLVSLLGGGAQWRAQSSELGLGEEAPGRPEDAFRGQAYLREALTTDPRIDMRIRTSMVIFMVALITYVLNQATPLTVKPDDRIFWISLVVLFLALAVAVIVYPRLSERRFYIVEQAVLFLAGPLVLVQVAGTGGASSPYLVWYVVIGFYAAYLLPFRQAAINLAWLSLLSLTAPAFRGEAYGDWLEVVALLMTIWVVARALNHLRSRENTLERTATFLALADPMTATANSRSFLQHLERLSEDRSRRFALAVVDMNGLKGANAVFGQDAGDSMVVRMGRLLTRSSGERDQVARLGGDEFAVAIADAGSAELELWRSGFERILGEHNAAIGGRLPQISAAIGTALHPADGERPNELLDAADRRMYEQKRSVVAPPYELDDVGSPEAIRSLRMVDVSTPPGKSLDVRERLRFATLNWLATALLALAVAVGDRPSMRPWAAAACGLYGVAWGLYCEYLRTHRVTARSSRVIDLATLLYTPILIWSTGGAQSPLLITVALPVAFYAQNFPGSAGLLRIGVILAGYSIGFWTTGTDGATEITQFVTILVSVLTMLGVMLYSARRQATALALIQSAASRDRLTDLPNLYALHSEVEAAANSRVRPEPSHPPQLLVFDIDDFRRVNTLAGHAGGDDVLRTIAGKLAGAAGEHRLHRIGGDEFAVLVRGLSERELDQLEQRCLDSVAGEYEVGSATISLTATAGRSDWSEGLSGEQLIDRAELSLRGRKSGKRRERPTPPEVML